LRQLVYPRQTTLKSLGILEGRAMMRLIDKKPEDLKTQAIALQGFGSVWKLRSSGKWETHLY